MTKSRITACCVFLVVVYLFGGCSSLHEIRIAGTNFKDEVNPSQNLVFTFNKDIVPEQKLNSWDSTPYIQFEPAVRGKFKWTAKNELVFSPVLGFEAASAYKARLTHHLAVHSDKGKKFDVANEPVVFHTPYLQIVETACWWTLATGSGRHEARLKLFFNYPVNGRQVAEKLKLARAGSPLGYKLLVSSDDKTVTLALPHTGKADNNAQPLEITLDKGVRAQNTSYISTNILTRTASLPSPLHLEVLAVKTEFENNAAFVRVTTSQQISPESIKAGFSINPECQVETEPSENGFVIRGDFDEHQTYTLRINKTLKGVLGHSPEEETSRDLFFGKMPAGIAFTNKKAVYMTPKGARNMGVQIINVPKVQVKISKLYANNILNYVRYHRWNEYSNVGDEWKLTGAFQYADDTKSEWSDVVVDKTVDTENLPKTKGISLLNIALPDHNQRHGLYLVSVNSIEEAYMGATNLISISDIGLIAKQGKDEIWIFANSIKTNEPLADLEITLISTNNQAIHTIKTNRQGVAYIDKLNEKAPGFKLTLITASDKDDFNYLLLDDTRVETSRFEVDGLRDNSSGFQAFVYGPREIYRPGETIHFNTVVRNENWNKADNIPLKIRLLTPNGREFRTWRKNTNEQGAVETEIKLDPAVLTGTYMLEVYQANDVLLASQSVSVEEFMPDRIKVDLSGTKQEYRSGETVTLTATAVNLFGPPAAGRTYEMESELQKKEFFAAGYQNYTFDIPSKIFLQRKRREGVTNNQGQTTERFHMVQELKDIGVLEGKIYVTVFDENGRPVNRLHRFNVFTQPIFYGINIPDTYVGINAPVPIDLIGVNSQGTLQKQIAAKIEVVRLEYQTVIEQRNNQLRYTSRKNEKVVYSNTLKLANGKGTVHYAPTVSGEYEVRVRRPGAMHFTIARFYAYGYEATQYASFEVSNEGRVLIKLDKATYKTGETARILFKAPFDGRLLVTVERNKILEQHILTTAKKVAELKIDLKDQHIPNVFVTATLIRPLDSSDLPLTVAHGFVPVLVENPDRKLPVTITSAPRSRSKSKQQIRVKTKPGAQVTLSVVDEGILQLKNTRTPDIHSYFYQKRALEVTSHDLYALLFPDLTISGVSSSGGDGYDLERRINPLSNGRTELVSFWSGVLTANASGKATFDIDIPQFSGDLRIMAVAFKDQAFGSASASMKVADPMVISTGSPRFLSPGDELIFPVNVSNTEKKASNATVTMQLSGPLANGIMPLSQNMIIAPGKEVMVMFSVKALQALGLGKIVVKVNAFGETFLNETALNVRPASPLLKTSSSGLISGGAQRTIDLTSGFIPATSRTQLVLSRTPLVQGGGKALAALLGYPYGCLEQTISKAFPQLYFADLFKAMATPVYLGKNSDNDLNPLTNVQQAIRKVESQQLFNGGMSLWPGATEEDWWTTAYAVHFLDEAKRAGFEVNAKTLTHALDYLIKKTGTMAVKEVILASTVPEDGLENHRPSSTIRKNATRLEAIYSLYVLALTGHPNRASMNYYKQNPQLLTLDARYLLAGAFQRTGDTRSFGSLLPGKYIQKPDALKGDESYSSPLRNLSLVLNTLHETDPDNRQIPVLTRQLSSAIQSAPYLNTQEAAFAILALGKVARQTSGSTVTASAAINGKAVGKFYGKELTLSRGLHNQKVLVRTQGKGNLYWFAQSEGMSPTGAYTEEDQGLRIWREFLTREGKPVASFRQNDLVVVRLSLSSTSGLLISNVVVTDMLPGGFEIENPRITEPRNMPWIKNASVPAHYDIRDDRIHFFTTAEKREKTFYYQVRITSKGTFQAGPAAADAMYRGEYRSYSGGRKIKVD